jgi:hypothetical protein
MGVISTQGFTYRLVANGVQLDLFQDEEIKVSNNVTGLFDIATLPSDFTRQITIPGTKKNNQFFEFVYDISVENPYTFATNQKVPAHIDFDGIYISQGYLQLNKVNVIANKFIDSYEVSLFGTLSSFSRDINRLFLTDITTLTQYNHTSSYANISASWNNNLFNGDIVYPWADYGNDWNYRQGFSYYNINQNVNPSAGITVQDFKPAIKIKKVWDAIFEQLGYTYSGNFWNTGYLDGAYMLLNHSLRYPIYSDVDLETYGIGKISGISASVGGGTNVLIPSASIVAFPWYNVESDPSNVIGLNSSYGLPISSSLQGTLNLNIKISGSQVGVPQVYLYFIETGSLATTNVTLPNINNYFFDKAQAMLANGATGINETFEVATEWISPLLSPGTYYFGIKWLNQYTSTISFVLDPGGDSKSSLEINKVRQAADGRVLDIALNMPYGTQGIKLVDFIKGIQKKFNLIIYPNKTKLNDFIVESWNDWFDKGATRDFNRYINLDNKIEVIPANNLAVNQLQFGDTLDTDYVSQQFFKGANREYGKQYYIDTQNFFSQGTLDVKSAFASAPLTYVQGTGLSGSVGGANPVITQYSAGTYQFTTTNGAQYACTSPIQIQIFTANGLLTSGQIAYTDQYGNTPLVGYYYFTNGLNIYPINHTTGQIGVTTALCRR